MEIYALDLDEELLSHIVIPDSWTVIKAEGAGTELIEDPEIAEIFLWQKDHFRQHKQLATATVLADEFDVDLNEPETAIGDLLDRMRERYMRNEGRRQLEEIPKVFKDDPTQIPQLLLRKGRELTAIITKRGEAFGTGDVDRAEHRYEIKASRGRGLSFGFAEIDDHFYGQAGLTYIVAPPKTYKALALDTPIPTPDGWKTQGTVQVGDQVFDEHGQPCNVININPICENRPCYQVSFSDGTHIVADAEHEWFTRTKTPWMKDAIYTTEEIRSTLTTHADKRRNHSIPVAGPLQYNCVELPIDPYVLGAWLGDGTGADGAISSADASILDEIRAAGYVVTKWASATYMYGILGLRKQLKSTGVYKNKHIPQIYLQGDYNQRLALLQGLMDTDGSCTDRGDCILVTTNPRLRDGSLELIRSLGLKPRSREYRAELHGKDCGLKWHIMFCAHESTPVFRLARKFLKQRPCSQENPRSKRRQIVSVDPVDSVPVRCITVDSESHLYLAGEGMVPTHNSWIMIQSAMQNVMDGKCIWLYSLELPPEETDMRIRCLLANIPWWKYLHNRLDKHDWKLIRDVSNYIDDCGIYRTVKPARGERGIDAMIENARDAGAEGIYIDQLQYVENAQGKSLGEMNDTGSYWGAMDRARDLSDEGPICIAHQFNRSAMHAEAMPDVSQAKGSSAIEETATLALGLWGNKDMRRSNMIEIGTLISRNHQYAAWELGIELTRGCNFEITGRVDDD